MGATERRRLAIAGAIALPVVVVAVLALAGVFSGDDGPDEEAPVDSGFGSAAGEPTDAPALRVARYRVGGRVDSISAGAGYVWAAGSENGTLFRLNPGSQQPIEVQAAGFPTDVSADRDAAWLALADRGAVQRVTGTEGPAPPAEVEGFPFGVAAGEGAVWALSQTSVEKVDPGSGTVDGQYELGGELTAIAAGEGGVWVIRDNEEIVKLAPAGGAEEATADVPGASSVATGEGAVWVLGLDGGGSEELTRVEPSGAVAGDPVPVTGAIDVAAGLGSVWVIDAGGGLNRFDPETGLPRGTGVEVGREPLAVTVGEGSAWVADAGSGAVYRVTPED